LKKTEKWMEIAVTQPVLNLKAGFLSWERSLISGHPTHPACVLSQHVTSILANYTEI
jgi:hypothetical protein